MKRHSPWFTPKRAGTTGVIWALLAQAVLPVYAVSTASPGYAGFMAQVPAIYSTPPDVNVMFTLDDSGSMQADALPDFSLPSVSYTGVPDNDASAFFNSSRNVSYPNMWGTGSSYLSTSLYQSTNAIARYMRSAAGNPLYYDRRVRYLPWPTAANDKVLSANATPSAARINTDTPFSGGTTINLTARVNVSGGSGSLENESNNYWPATYFIYKGATPLPPATPNTALNTSANFTKVAIKTALLTPTFARATKTVGGVLVADDARTDCGTGTLVCTHAQELQNFANWLQYYRNRRLMAKGGVAAAFALQGTNLRTGFARINASPVVRRGVRTFSGTDRTDFYNLLYNEPSGNGLTPLRKAMDDVGQHFTLATSAGPWAQFPGTSVGTEYSCRRSFHVLSTDGFWNDAQASTSAARNNNDSFSGNTPAKPDGTTYAFSDTATSATDALVGRFTVNPLKDGNSNTLADVAAYYWKTDLRSTLANNVAPSPRDPAFWQHLTTFTIGLGISGSGDVARNSDGSKTIPVVPSSHALYPFVGKPWLANQGSRDWLVANKTVLDWTTPAADNPATGDDLIHASMNGRGRYFSANNPTDLANGLASALSEAADQPLDYASVAADAPQVRDLGKVYQAVFSPSKWYGRLYAFGQDAETGLVNNKPTDSSYTNPTQLWEASNKMPAPGLRNIFTSAGSLGTGSTFTWAGLNAGQKANLNNDATLLDYLRGDGSKEIANAGAFRDRSRYTVGAVTGGVLGDLVNGSPVKGPDYGGGYDRLPASDTAGGLYSAFRTGSTLDNLRNTIFLGANDGMLHAFDVSDGVERFAYLPNALYNVPRSTSGGLAEKKLQLLSDPTYTHRFTVDGPPNVSDVYVGGGWKTVLTAANGAGARGIFALDVTNTVVGAGGFGTSKAMWEFTEANHSDMGFVLGYPHAVRMRDGNWAAIFGNGFDSVNGRAKLFILNLATGAVLKEMAVDTGTPGNNGLSQPNFVLNDKREVVGIYAGDLKGNLWKFDVSGLTPASWNVAFGGTPLFSAVNASGQAQPITVMPEITLHTNGGAQISFGTGKLFEASDTNVTNPPNVNLNVQSLYGIWDKPSETTGIAMTSATRNTVLKPHTAAPIASPDTYGATSATIPDWTNKRGWFLDLESGGERVSLAPQQVGSVLIMVANKPVLDPCANGGSSKIFILDPVTGAAPAYPVFDINNDKTFSVAENGFNVKLNNSGLLTQPIFQLPKLSSFLAPTSGLSPLTVFDRGQTSAARGGGVELAKSFGGTLGTTSPGLCAMLMTAAQSDTTLMSQFIRICNPPATPATKPRISWRQLR